MLTRLGEEKGRTLDQQRRAGSWAGRDLYFSVVWREEMWMVWINACVHYSVIINLSDFSSATR